MRFFSLVRLGALPIFLVYVFIERSNVLELLESLFSLTFVHFPIYWISTFIERFLLASIYACWVLGVVVLTHLVLPLRFRTWANFGIIATGTVVVFIIMQNGYRYSLWIGLGLGLAFILIANAVPRTKLEKLFNTPRLSTLMKVVFVGGVIVIETFFPRPFWLWVSGKTKSSALAPLDTLGHTLSRYTAGGVVTTIIFAAMLPYNELAKLGRIIHSSPEVNHFYGGTFELYTPYDVTGIVFDPSTDRLFFCGNGLTTIQVVYTGQLDAPPQETKIPTSHGQFFAIDSKTRDLFIVQRDLKSLVTVGLDHFQITDIIKLPQLPPGEVLIAKHRSLPLIVTASEGVILPPNSIPTRVLDLQTMQFLNSLEIAPGYMTIHPTKPFIYFDFFQGRTGIELYDLLTGKLLAKAESDSRSDRMIVDTRRDELLVTSPINSRILVYDAKTLKHKGSIPTVFGVRGIAIDEERDLALATSLLTNQLDRIDLKSRRSTKHFRLGPWLRDIALDIKSGIAYVSSRHGVYAVQYAEPLSTVAAISE